MPLHLRNAPTRMMKNMGYGTDYKYSHDHSGEPDHQNFLPEEIKGRVFYRPKEVGSEQKIRKFMEQNWGKTYRT